MHRAVDDNREIEGILKFEVELNHAFGDVASTDGGIYAMRGICRAAWTVRMAVYNRNTLRNLEQGVIQRGGNLTGAAAGTRDGFAVNQNGGILVTAALAIRPGDCVKIEDIARVILAVDVGAAHADVFHASLV